MALSVFPSLSRWHNCPIEGRHTVGGLMNRLLEDFENSFEPLWECNTTSRNSFSEIVDDKENFGIQLNVNHFKPEELSVKMQNGTLCVEGHHEERSDQHGSVERHFIRKYTVPKTVLQDSLESQLSDQGVLRITAEKKTVESPQIKNIPIQFSSTNNDKH